MGPRIIVLTGERGAGKSTVCREIIALAQAKGYTCGGVLTVSHPDGTLDVLDVHSGDVRRLTVGPDVNPAIVQGRFRFDPDTLAWGNAALAHTTPCDLLVVDELGPLEIERGGGWSKAFDVLRGADFALAVTVVRPELVVQSQLRLPTTRTNGIRATTVLDVTPEDRDSLPLVLLEMLEREISSTSEG